MSTTVTAAKAMTLRKNSTTKMAARAAAARPAWPALRMRMLRPAAAAMTSSRQSRGSR